MATGTVSVHSFSDGMEDDEGLPAMSSNYNARLDLREDFNSRASAARTLRGMATRSTGADGGGGFAGRILRSRVVRAAVDDDAAADDDDMPRLPGAW
jgi:hypothetical protein